MLRRTQVLLSEDQLRRLRREAKRRGSSVGALVRQAVDHAFPAAKGDRAAAYHAIVTADLPIEGDWQEIERRMAETLAEDVLR